MSATVLLCESVFDGASEALTGLRAPNRMTFTSVPRNPFGKIVNSHLHWKRARKV